MGVPALGKSGDDSSGICRWRLGDGVGISERKKMVVGRVGRSDIWWRVGGIGITRKKMVYEMGLVDRAVGSWWIDYSKIYVGFRFLLILVIFKF